MFALLLNFLSFSLEISPVVFDQPTANFAVNSSKFSKFFPISSTFSEKLSCNYFEIGLSPLWSKSDSKLYFKFLHIASEKSRCA